jgi:predicted MFS family arabinose efflux permease
MTTPIALELELVPVSWSVPQRARAATLTAFFVQGVIFSTWVSRIPVVQEHLKLSNSTLGMALLAISAAAMVSMPVTGVIVAKLGSRRFIRVGGIMYCLSMLLPALATDLWQLLPAVVAIGTMLGAMNVAINSQAVTVERAYGRPIMSAFHALFSLGGMAGSIAGGMMAGLGVPIAAHFGVVAVAMAIVALLTTPWMLPDPPHAAQPADDALKNSPRRGAFLNSTLLLLGTLAFCVSVGEGAMADWSAVYLHRGLGTGVGFAAVGYAVFSLAMTSGRFTADRSTARLGPRRLVQLGGTVAAVGLSMGLISHIPVLALIGFVCAGFGFAGVVPILFSAAARTPGVKPSVGISVVSTIGFLGFLLGPPAIGFAADWTSLSWALGIVVATSAIAVLLARNVRQESAMEENADLDSAVRFPSA